MNSGNARNLSSLWEKREREGKCSITTLCHKELPQMQKAGFNFQLNAKIHKKMFILLCSSYNMDKWVCSSYTQRLLFDFLSLSLTTDYTLSNVQSNVNKNAYKVNSNSIVQEGKWINAVVYEWRRRQEGGLFHCN